MKKLITVLFILSFAAPSLATPIGGPDITVPEESLCFKEREVVINKTLDRYEYNKNLKAGLDIDIVVKRRLTSARDVSEARLDGQNYLLKFSTEFYNVVEPYIKIGTSNLEVKWNQYGRDVKVESTPGFVYGLGFKAPLCELKNYGVKLTLDMQYVYYNLGIDKAKAGGTEPATEKEKFNITEWQTSLLASKKFIFPIGMRDYYVIPYGGITFSSTDVDVMFENVSLVYSTYNASDENVVGLVFGCDIMPFFLSYYLFNFELRLINELAFSLGGKIKF